MKKMDKQAFSKISVFAICTVVFMLFFTVVAFCIESYNETVQTQNYSEEEFVGMVSPIPTTKEEQELSDRITKAYNDRKATERANGQDQSFEEDLPTSYDLRNEGVISGVKLQNPFGDCWAFATIAASEASIRTDLKAAGKSYGDIEFSERHLAWFKDKQIAAGHASGQGGEGVYFPTGSYYTPMQTGGNSSHSITLLSSGSGLTARSAYPYNGIKNGAISYEASADWSISDANRFESDYILKEALSLPATYNKDTDNYNTDAMTEIKKQVKAGKAVQISILGDGGADAPYLNTEDGKYAQYVYEYKQSNHAVTVVGWDDNYSKNNFKAGNLPPSDGAWIIKNSWGSETVPFYSHDYMSWGTVDSSGKHTGYFYLSYYDKSMTGTSSVYNYETQKDESDIEVKAYDYLPARGWNAKLSYDAISTANIFTADKKCIIDSVSTVIESDVKISFYVYKLNSNYSHPMDGTLLGKVEDIHPEFSGFERVSISDESGNPIIVDNGDKYSVICKQQMVTGDYPGAYTTPYIFALKHEQAYGPGGSLITLFKTNGVVNAGESYLFDYNNPSDNQDWTEIKNEFETNNPNYTADNPPIKAYVKEYNPSAKDINTSTTATVTGTFTYSGNAITPIPTVTDNESGAQLVEDTDYTISYQSNINATTESNKAKIILTGMGNYTGTKTIDFVINPYDISTNLNVSINAHRFTAL
ncbi:MAG: hypothetical protein MJ189_00790 [Coriobacteriales bacterium]|nr:hypothetical protein [Coriobacteriales bacterium]